MKEQSRENAFSTSPNVGYSTSPATCMATCTIVELLVRTAPRMSALSLLDRGAEMAEAGRTAEAIKLFRQAAAASRNNPDVSLAAHRNLGHALMELDRATEAAASFRRALQIVGDNEVRTEIAQECAAAHVQIASSAQRQPDAEDVVAAALEEALLLLPGDPELQRALAEAQSAAGVAHASAGRHEPAELATRRAIDLAAGEARHAALSASAYVNLGLIQLRRSRAAGRLAGSDHAAEAEPLSAFRAAVEHDPSNGDAYYHAANQLRALGRAEEAIGAYERGVAASPTHAGLHSSLGYALLSSGSTERGAELLRAAAARGVWRGGSSWQYPADLAPSLQPAVRIHGIGERMAAATTTMMTRRLRWLDSAVDRSESDSWRCVLAPLEAASALIAGEASAWLPRFHEQHEAIAVPRHGWRELDLSSACDAEAPSASNETRLTHTCAAIAAVRARGVSIRGAAFSALMPGTRLLAHSGTTNRRLTLHLGLSVPTLGSAVLRIGRPASVLPSTSPGADATDDADAEPIELAWAEGGAFLWDDSYAHEVFWRPPHDRVTSAVADGDAFARSAPRVILLLTLAHPSINGERPTCD